MNANEALIDRFYTAFAARNADDMIRCYHPDIHFSDSVFVDLGPHQSRAMWRMLAERASDLRIEHSRVQAADLTGTAHWEAWYSFSATKRPVHNVIDARFEFRDGLIARHTDTFDLYRWARQALGPAGWVLGAPGFRAAIRRKARAGLEDYLRSKPAAGDPA